LKEVGNMMPDQHYELVGEDKETGIPSDQRLNEPGIEKISH